MSTYLFNIKTLWSKKVHVSTKTLYKYKIENRHKILRSGLPIDTLTICSCVYSSKHNLLIVIKRTLDDFQLFPVPYLTLISNTNRNKRFFQSNIISLHKYDHTSLLHSHTSLSARPLITRYLFFFWSLQFLQNSLPRLV